MLYILGEPCSEVRNFLNRDALAPLTRVNFEMSTESVSLELPLRPLGKIDYIKPSCYLTEVPSKTVSAA